MRVAAGLAALTIGMSMSVGYAQDGGSATAPAATGETAAPSSTVAPAAADTGATVPGAVDPAATTPADTTAANMTGTPDQATTIDLAALQSRIPANPVYDSLAADFDRNPKVFFDGFVARGSSVAVPARNVLLSRPAAIDQVIEAMRTYGLSTEPARQLAVGVGQAALVYSKTLPEVSVAFQERMAALESETIRLAFSAATGDIATAALGFGSVGAGGGTASASGPSISGNSLSGSANSGSDGPIDVLSRQAGRSGGLTLGAVGDGGDGDNLTVVICTSPTTFAICR
ncbi:hypothetical protein ASG48_07240 [Aurantimonas sp. Leaf443]|nr:hypothetical protein ASG48_07240 [Aurantimonas sp. Leaf443]